MKQLNHLILMLAVFLLASCSTQFRLIGYDQNNDVSARNVSTSFAIYDDGIEIDTLTEFQFRNKLRTDFNFRLDFARYALSQPRSFDWNNRLLGTRYNWNRNIWGYSYYNYWDRDRMWNDWAWGFTPHRWSPFGYDRWGYNSGWNSWNSPYNWYGSHFNNYYSGWPYWGNNVYASPYWRHNRPNTVYVNGRRGSTIQNETQNNRRRVNTTTRRNTNRSRNNEVIINNNTNRNNNTRVRVYQRPENNSNTRPSIRTKPSVNQNNRPSNNSRPVINNSRPSTTRSSTPVRSRNNSAPTRKRDN